MEVRVLIGEGLGNEEREADFRRALHELVFIERPCVGHDCSFPDQGPAVQPDPGLYSI